MSSRYFLAAINSQGTLRLAFLLFGKHSCTAYMWNDDKVFIFVIWRISLICLLKSINLVSHNYRILTAYIPVGKLEQSYHKTLRMCFIFLRRLRRIFYETIL